MSKSPFYKGLSPVAIYKRYAAILHLLESVENKVEKETYEDMYGRLLDIGKPQIVRLYSMIESGRSGAVLNYLKRRKYKGRPPLDTDAKTRRHARRKKMRATSKAA